MKKVVLHRYLFTWLQISYSRWFSSKISMYEKTARKSFNDIQMPEAVIRRCSEKKVFLEILQNLKENTCARVSFLIKLQVWGCNVSYQHLAFFQLFMIFPNYVLSLWKFCEILIKSPGLGPLWSIVEIQKKPSRVYYRIAVLIFFQKFKREEARVQESSFNKVLDLQTEILIKLITDACSKFFEIFHNSYF